MALSATGYTIHSFIADDPASTSNGCSHHDELSRLAAHLEGIVYDVKGCGGVVPLPPGLAGEIAAAAQEVVSRRRTPIDQSPRLA